MTRKIAVTALLASLAGALLSLASPGPALADEGMWTFDNLPVAQLRDRYGFTPTQAWLEHVRLASVKVGRGGSGSFVSPDGLLLTNHHVARGQLQNVSSSEKDYVTDGFLAASRDQELKCPDLEVKVLIAMEDVTQRVLSAAADAPSFEAALDARQAETAAIEKESLERTGLQSEVVSLYHGGEYWLYRYQHYDDVRLVFAPEVQAAYFGGDDDNFTFPRHDLDMTLLRVYKDGEPIRSPAWLPLDPAGARDGDLVFVSGHPGSTDRLFTMAQLAYLRDFEYPRRMASIDTMLALTRAYATRGAEQARQVRGRLLGLSNSQKVRAGEYRGLTDEHIWSTKQKDEADFRARVEADPDLTARYGDAWSMSERATEAQRDMADAHDYMKMPGYNLARTALTIVRLVAEREIPDSERLEGYHDSELRRRTFMLYSPAPLYPELVQFNIFNSLRRMKAALGADDPFVTLCLDGKSPADRARELTDGTELFDPEVRRALVEGGAEAVAASTDPLIVLARNVDPLLRDQERAYEEKVTSVEQRAGEMLGAARFAIYGKSTYPDATGTLRLAFGQVKGYPMNGTVAPSRTTFYGLFDRAFSFGLQDPFSLPARILERKDALDLATPLDFVSTCDIIGGNSGSPVVDVDGRIVGLIFDGNIESLVGRFVFDETAGRAVAVHAAAIDAALRTIYDAGFLADEMSQPYTGAAHP